MAPKYISRAQFAIIGMVSSLAVALFPWINDVHAASVLVAAYNFNAGSGTVLADVSGNGNNGILVNGPIWTTAGKFGGALLFDGTNDLVTINDSSSLDLTSGMTLEAWVNPRAITNWRTVILKERSPQLSYALYAATRFSKCRQEPTSSTAS